MDIMNFLRTGMNMYISHIHVLICYTFLKGICPKVNIIAQLEYEHAYYDSAVRHFNHYTTRTPPQYIWLILIIYTQLYVVHLAGAVKYTDCFSVEE